MQNAARFFIGGQWVQPEGTERIEIRNPADLSVIGHATMGGPADIDKAVSAARAAFADWQTSSVDQRLTVLCRMREAFVRLAPRLEEHLVREIGLVPMVAQGQTRMCLSHFDAVLELLPQYQFSSQPRAGIELLREPIGVVGAITSWNAPVSQMLCKAVPAIAAGCTVVVKPSEQAPLCAMLLAEAMTEAELPDGLFAIINGRGADCGDRLAAHPDVDMISITGSVTGGAAAAAAAAPTIKRIHQELGGKSANILLPDADFAEAVPRGVRMCMMAGGQVCAAPTRMIVPLSRFDEIAEMAVATAEQLIVGPPDRPGVAYGPLANEAQFKRVNALIAQAISGGQPLLTGGPGRPANIDAGYFVAPTIFGPVHPDAKIAREEVFGPVLCIMTYRDIDEAIRLANATDYGLSGYVESANPEEARRVARALRTGYVNINCPPWSADAPFGGYRRSGNGKQYGVWGMEEFLDVKAIVG